MQTRTNYHVGFVFQNRIDQARNLARRISSIAVDHHIDIGVNATKHRLHHKTLALSWLRHERRAGGQRAFRGAVSRIVIEDIDARLRQLIPECIDDLSDGQLFVVAGN